MDKLLKKMQTNGVLLDTNLLVLLIIGLVDVNLIQNHKKLNAYSKDDFKLLLGILNTCRKIVVTPHILAETSNLAVFGAHDDIEKKIFFALHAFMLEKKFIESYIQGCDISNKDGFLKFGLSDIGLLETLKTKYVLLTDDFRLSGYAESRNLDSLNFNHLKYGF